MQEYKNQREYLNDVESDAQYLIDEVVFEHLGTELDDLADFFRDAIQEYADSQCIYHYMNRQIMLYSPNSSAIDDIGAELEGLTIDQAIDQGAYWAYVTDLNESVEYLLSNTDIETYTDISDWVQVVKDKVGANGYRNKALVYSWLDLIKSALVKG